MNNSIEVYDAYEEDLYELIEEIKKELINLDSIGDKALIFQLISNKIEIINEVVIFYINLVPKNGIRNPFNNRRRY
jgi:hypothetical protein